MTTKKRILIGNADFEYMVSNNGYFIDKTLFIKEFYNSANHVLLIPRPRRFGKTMNLSMTEHFFDIQKPESKKLFEEFKINEDKAFCEAHQNQYPIINLSLKSVRGNTWKECFADLKDELSFLYKQSSFLLESTKLKKYEKLFLEKIILGNGSKNDYRNSLRALSNYLKNHFGKKVIILLDEYDTPIINGYKNNYYADVIEFMQVFLGRAFKENPYLQKGLLTGIMRIARESIFSEMNNIGVFTILDPFFQDKFGFIEQETKDLLQYFGLQQQFDNVKYWYDGYQFGNNKSIYNPWSIINYISRNKQGFKPYWVNTGTDSLLREQILKPDVDQTYNTLHQLITGQTIQKIINESFVFADFDTKKELLWTLLLFSGYLTIGKKIKTNKYNLKIPNHEIKTIFQELIISWLENKVRIKSELLTNTINHLVNNQLAEFEKGFRKIMGDTFSYFDTRGIPENVYQSYVLGLLAVIGDEYIIKSNRESGEGRYDILMIPRDKTQFGVVIEIKQLDIKETDKNLSAKINRKLQEAATQIEQKEYYKELIEHKIENIIKVPIVFVGKKAYVNKTGLNS